MEAVNGGLSTNDVSSSRIGTLTKGGDALNSGGTIQPINPMPDSIQPSLPIEKVNRSSMVETNQSDDISRLGEGTIRSKLVSGESRSYVVYLSDGFSRQAQTQSQPIIVYFHNEIGITSTYNNRNNNNNYNNNNTASGGQGTNSQHNGNNGGRSTNDVQSSETPKKGGDALNSGGTIPPIKPHPDSIQSFPPMEMRGNPPPTVEPHQSDDHRLVEEATNQSKVLLANEPNPPTEKIIQTRSVPRLVQILSRDDLPQLQSEAVTALTEITICNAVNINNLATDYGIISVFVKLLSSPNDDVREKATSALGQIAATSTRCRDIVLDNEALPPLLAMLNKHAKPSLLKLAARTLYYCCKQEPFDKIKTALPALGALMQFSNDEEILKSACDTLKYLCDRNYGNSHAVIEAGVFPWLHNLLQRPSRLVLNEALSTVESIVKGDAINFQAAINADIFGPIIPLLQDDTSYVQGKAFYVMKDTMLRASCEQIKYFVDKDYIESLCDLLSCSTDLHVCHCLEMLSYILKAGEAEKNAGNTGGVNLYAQKIAEAGGWKIIKNLQSYETNFVQAKAVMIFKTYNGHQYED